MALAAEVAGGRQVHLERLHVLRRVVVVRNGRSGHFDVVTAEEEQKRVAREANDVGHEDELHSTFGFELKAFEEEAADEDADASAGDGDGAGEDARLALAQAELRLEVLRQEDDKATDDHQLHARAEARHDVHRVGYQTPHRERNVWRTRKSDFSRFPSSETHL